MITNIFWKRTYFFIEYTASAPMRIAFYNQKLDRTIEMSSRELEPGHYRAKLNFTIADGRHMFPDGNWELVQDDPELALSDDLLYHIEDFTRTFRYSGGKCAYIVAFDVRETEEHTVILCMHISYMIQNPHPEVRPNKSERLLNLANKYYQFMARRYPKDGTRILFFSQNMDHIRDNMKAIDERLHERGLDKQFKISYLFQNIFDHKPSARGWFQIVNTLAKQDYIFVDDYVPIFAVIKLLPSVKLIQVWHAGFGFKLVGYGRFGIKGSPHPYVACHREYDYALIGNKNLREIYSEVFGIEPEALLASGMPRLEHFLDKDHVEEVTKQLREKYPQFSGKRVILYAPTYRGYSQKDAFFDADCLDFDALTELCRETNSVFVFKMHHFIREAIAISEEQKEYLYDLSDENLNDLFYISDELITDYSSCFYDFLLLEKPVIFYVYDKALYTATRGVHRPIDQVAPGIVCNNFSELMTALKDLHPALPAASAMLTDNCLTNDQFASDMVIDHVLLGKDVPRLCEK